MTKGHPPAWIVVNVGCIECRVSSNVVGVFTDEGEAQRTAEQLQGIFYWREGGENKFEVFPMPSLNKIHEEYRAK